MGGGFTALALPSFDESYRCSIAAILRIPAELTGEGIPISGHVESAAGERLDGWSLGGEIVAAPEGVPGGGDATVVVAGPVELSVDGPTDVLVKLRFGPDERSARVHIEATNAR